jgi:hypothetical protein
VWPKLASGNRVRHGRTGVQKANDARDRERAAKAAANARLDDKPR